LSSENIACKGKIAATILLKLFISGNEIWLIIDESQLTFIFFYFQRYPVMWQGVLGLKNDNCVVQMHFISGFQPLVKMSLPQPAPDGTVQPLRIAQRMRLEQAQLEGVEKRMQVC